MQKRLGERKKVDKRRTAVRGEVLVNRALEHALLASVPLLQGERASRKRKYYSLVGVVPFWLCARPDALEAHDDFRVRRRACGGSREDGVWADRVERQRVSLESQ